MLNIDKRPHNLLIFTAIIKIPGGGRLHGFNFNEDGNAVIKEEFERGRFNMNNLNTELSLHLFIFKFDKTICLFSINGWWHFFFPILFVLVLVQYKSPLMCIYLTTKVK